MNPHQANPNIFCSTPWYELHIYWDGGLGVCCQEAHRLYSADQNSQYNIAHMTISEWIMSEPVQNMRREILGDKKLSACRRCYVDEQFGPTSRRHKSNQKSVIFTKENFRESFEQSPGWPKFSGAAPVDLPIDLHIDLGNYCNLACKMCTAEASSTIAVQEVRWGRTESQQYVGTDWTRDTAVWLRVLNEIASIPNLSNIHFMGGETLITPRFEQFVDAMIAAGRTDVGISFVTNGTHFNSNLIQKLTQFKRVGIEVSIESTTEHNAYQRQGTDTAQVLRHIDRYYELTNNNTITVTLRPAVSALTIGTYWTLLEYALERQLLVKGQIAFTPEWIHPAVLPAEVRRTYRDNYQQLIDQYQLTSNATDFNESDPHQYRVIIHQQIMQMLNLLDEPTHEGLFDQLVAHCQRWDSVYSLDAKQLYPELAQEFDRYGY
jgi:molybdenum cofactor biosynthesis enzyme MoaA